jgi:hypothetical protein
MQHYKQAISLKPCQINYFKYYSIKQKLFLKKNIEVLNMVILFFI